MDIPDDPQERKKCMMKLLKDSLGSGQGLKWPSSVSAKAGMPWNPFGKDPRGRAKIEAPAIDMSQAGVRAVTYNLPKTILVFDHFHVISFSTRN